MKVAVVLGLAFGDEGKGSIVDWLARRAAGRVTVVRWNGGPQAAHHVVTPEGRVFCFAQLGAGSFVPGARTHLGRDMAVDALALLREAELFGRDVLERVSIDPRALLVTPWHATLNQIREVARGAARHGSTGRGVAEARLADERGEPAVRVGDADIEAKLRAVRDWALATAHAVPHAPSELDKHLAHPALLPLTVDAFERVRRATTLRRDLTLDGADDEVILEGAQGALLDRDHGEHPWVTPSRVTRRAAVAALAELGLAEAPVTCWGVLRAYFTRHGAGPFATEDAALAARLPELHNADGPWQGPMRIGWFDAVLARRALGFAGPIDHLALTSVDRVESLPELRLRTPDGWAVSPPGARYLSHLEAVLDRPIDLVSHGPTANDKRLRNLRGQSP